MVLMVDLWIKIFGCGYHCGACSFRYNVFSGPLTCFAFFCIRATTESRVLLVNSVNSPIKKYSDFTHTDLFQIVVLGIQMICSHLLYVLVAIFILIVQPWYTCYDMFSCHLIISDENHSYPPVGGGFIYPRMYFVFEHLKWITKLYHL